MLLFFIWIQFTHTKDYFVLSQQIRPKQALHLKIKIRKAVNISCKVAVRPNHTSLWITKHNYSVVDANFIRIYIATCCWKNKMHFFLHIINCMHYYFSHFKTVCIIWKTAVGCIQRKCIPHMFTIWIYARTSLHTMKGKSDTNYGSV